MPSPILLDHRAVLVVSGADAEAFLQGLVTVSTLDMREGETRYGALLTPQGKIIADMILTRDAGEFLIDCDAGVAPSLLKRLSLFRLRAAVAISDRSDLGVIAFEGTADPRSPDAPQRKIGPRPSAPKGDPARYHAARIAAGLPEQGVDFSSEEIFPADVNMDLLGGVDFRKGCFVGQEVVSRIEHRGTARNRIVGVRYDEFAPEPGVPVQANEKSVGTLGSTARGRGLAMLRIDRVAEALAKGERLTAGGIALEMIKPAWARFALPGSAQAGE